MELARAVRQWLPPLVLAVLAFVGWRAANGADFGEVGSTDVPYELAVQTPVFSARRLPITLQTPINDVAIRPAIQRAIEQAPSGADGGTGKSCLSVRDGDRQLGALEEPAGGLVPASNQKMLTTYGALGVLGIDFRFVTTVAASDAPVDGSVTDLYIIGGGDPFLVTEDWTSQYEDAEQRTHTNLEELADAVVAAGITEVTGTLFGDETLYDSQRTVSAWDARFIAQKQSGPLSALTVNEGFVDWPDEFQNSFRPRNETTDPPLHAAAVFGQLLSERGVSIAANGSGATPPSAVEVAALESPRLSEIVTHVNSFSSNIGAELLLKRIGYEVKGVGSTEAGTQALFEFLEGQGIPMNDVRIDDGSGLAESNRVTCTALVSLLTQSSPGSEFGASLAIAGERGSLVERFVDTEAEGKVLAKTGTLRGVKALSGYALSSSDGVSNLAFAFLVNDEVLDDSPLEIQDSLLSALVGYPAGPALDRLAPLPAATPE